MTPQAANPASSETVTVDKAKYVVLDEHTLCYRLDSGPKTLGVLHGSVLRGGHDWKNGPVTFVHESQLRPATLEDFDFYRVSPTGHIC